MSKISDFYSTLMQDEVLKKELVEILEGKSIFEANDKQLMEIRKIAEKLSMDISLDEAKNFLSGNSMELDDNDLDAVAGGKGETSKIELYKGDELKFQCFGSNGGSVI